MPRANALLNTLLRFRDRVLLLAYEDLPQKGSISGRTGKELVDPFASRAFDMSSWIASMLFIVMEPSGKNIAVSCFFPAMELMRLRYISSIDPKSCEHGTGIIPKHVRAKIDMDLARIPRISSLMLA